MTASLMEAAPRPFYGEFAWAYDYLVERPVAAECDGIAARLARRGIRPGARVLDAGCGTGRYAAELGRRGFVVNGLDRSPALLAEAEARVRDSGGAPVRFERGEILELPAGSGYDVILCRGVLNDFVDDGARGTVFGVFARALRTGGMLLVDVRDWDGTVARRAAQPVHERRVATPRGPLVFRSESRLDPAGHLLRVSERHTLSAPTGETTAAYELVMRCWTRDELETGLRAAGFGAIEHSASYEIPEAPGPGDRIVTSAVRGAG